MARIFKSLGVTMVDLDDDKGPKKLRIYPRGLTGLPHICFLREQHARNFAEQIGMPWDPAALSIKTDELLPYGIPLKAAKHAANSPAEEPDLAEAFNEFSMAVEFKAELEAKQAKIDQLQQKLVKSETRLNSIIGYAMAYHRGGTIFEDTITHEQLRDALFAFQQFVIEGSKND